MAWVRGVLVSLLIIFIVIPFLLVAISVVNRLWLYYSGPLQNEGDVWVSEDGKITLTTTMHCGGIGKMQLDNDIIEFEVSDAFYEQSLAITYPKDNADGVQFGYESWDWDRKSRSEYVMTVTGSDAGYFTVGETITFYRADSLPTSSSD